MSENLKINEVQVDCRGLNDSKIKRMVGIFKGHGIKLINNYDALIVGYNYYYLRLNSYNSLGVLMKDNSKKTITYDEFIEFFDNKEKKQEIEVKSGWYKDSGYPKFLVYHDFKNVIKYGFDTGGEWFFEQYSSTKRWDYDLNNKASNEEVFTALNKEAKKRGFKKGATFNHEGSDIYCAHDNVYLKNNALYYRCYVIMEDGVWAEIVENTIKPIKNVIHTVGYGDKEETIVSGLGRVLAASRKLENAIHNEKTQNNRVYEIAKELHLNHYEFDILRLLTQDKDNLKNNLQEIKKVINLYLDSLEE